MVRFFAFFALATWLVGAAYADAERPVLVELFANQNCPACPKAHRTMQQINAERDDVLILTWTVNYWDYLGDPDPMSLPEAKDRQMSYTDRLSLRAPYTPQSFYDGAKECPGTRKRDIRRNISKRVDLRDANAPYLNWADNALTVMGKSDATLEITLVEYLSGEANTTTMVNPVTRVESLGLWMDDSTPIAIDCEQNCAVLLQEQDNGVVVSAIAIQ
ncbi:MAG: DUF1223 domain-containing protein [Henriciella sp.]|nr:DUF1223 domain-containing protein [Henriciella sp.]